MLVFCLAVGPWQGCDLIEDAAAWDRTRVTQFCRLGDRILLVMHRGGLLAVPGYISESWLVVLNVECSCAAC